MSINTLDPYAIDRSEPLEKYTFHYENGAKVRIKEDGRTGKLEGHNQSGAGFMVRLDTGHLVECRRDEIEPEDLPSAPRRSMTATEKAFAKAHSPYGGFDDDEPSVLDAKLEAAGVSVTDRVLIKRCAENIRSARVVTSPFGVDAYEDENRRNLRVMASKYAKDFLVSPSATPEPTGTDSALQKAAANRSAVDDLIEKSVAALRAGKNIVLPRECRAPFARIPVLQAAVVAGRISFDYGS